LFNIFKDLIELSFLLAIYFFLFEKLKIKKKITKLKMSPKIKILTTFSYKSISFSSREDYGVVYEIGLLFYDGRQTEICFKLNDPNKKFICLEIDLDGNMVFFTDNYDKKDINIFI